MSLYRRQQYTLILNWRISFDLKKNYKLSIDILPIFWYYFKVDFYILLTNIMVLF